MSLYASLYSGVSGLTAYSSSLGTISDNIANVNTVGYKETRSQFSTLVTESKSTTSYSPGGVQSLPQSLISRQGLLQSSASATDLSIDGSGFFVVGETPDEVFANSSISFTRAGSFTPDDEGYLKNTAGLYLLGFPIDENGNIPVNREVGSLDPINVSGLTGTAEATTEVTVRANLQSSLTPSVQAATYDATVPATSIASGSVSADFQRNVQVFDEQGGTHTVTIAALKQDPTQVGQAVNQWFVEIFVEPATDITPGVGLHNGQIATGTLAFNSDGTIDHSNTSAALLNAVPISWTNGATQSDIAFDLGTDATNDGFTQFDSLSTLISSSVNGAVFGNVTGVNINDEGIVTALFDNGLTREVYQLPIATFQNPDGLNRRQGNSYTRSDQSGTFALQLAGTGGAGFVAPSTLEASTVDLGNEFTQLITTQRAYAASTRIITTADEMLNELNNIKR
ncbi:MAG: flagellar biosynthesis protein FlgE [Kordiimonas sp.]|nr:flagellar biosynthesis protein FlgE [Kordiimonas sp.]|tara:strand:- start:1898 stop:3259 length:1362 start_codon:yes stop_codon:yes gene_type:complete